MSRTESTKLRDGRSMVLTADYRLIYTSGPDIWGHLDRHGIRWDWEVTPGFDGEAYAWGTAWTLRGARGLALAAAHKPRPAEAVTHG